MVRIEKAVSNSGPLIHLAQARSFNALGIVKHIFIPQEVFDEVCIFNLPGNKEVRGSSIIRVKDLGPKAKDFSKLISDKYSLDLGEAESISLAKQEGIKLFLTDDLAARLVAQRFGLEPHGTIGIVLRAFRAGILKKEKAVQIIKDLHNKSSLFITTDLVNSIIKEVLKSRN